MNIKELYYINKWKPKYNIKDKQKEKLELIIKEDDIWIPYNKYKKIKHLEEQEINLIINDKQVLLTDKERKHLFYSCLQNFNKKLFSYELISREKLKQVIDKYLKIPVNDFNNIFLFDFYDTPEDTNLEDFMDIWMLSHKI